MNIGFITTFGVKCGIATYTDHLAQQLGREHEVVIFAEDYLDNKQPDFSSNLKVMRCFDRNHSSPRLLEALRANPCDIVHVQHEYGIFGKLKNDLEQVAAECKGRTVMTLHTARPWRGKFHLQDCADCFIVHNTFGEQYLLGQGIEASKIKVITHGTLILPRISQREARTRLRLPLDGKIVQTHSFFERRKHIDKVIEAVAKLKGKLALTYIHIGGTHPHLRGKLERSYLGECVRLSREMGIASEVVIIERFVSEEEMGYYLAAADVIVVMEKSTYPEVHASGVLHTVSPGKPVIASDIPDFAEFPDDALYRIDNDAESLAQALRELLSDSGLTSRLSENLLRYAQATSWENIARIHTEVYGRAVSSRKLVHPSEPAAM